MQVLCIIVMFWCGIHLVRVTDDQEVMYVVYCPRSQCSNIQSSAFATA